ncbi:MAG: ATP-binding protein [Bacillota bacterium]|nr:ATP-binding protein [Bacillota bacterium]
MQSSPESGAPAEIRREARLDAAALRRTCRPEEIPPAEEALEAFRRTGLIGQERAARAMELGLAMRRPRQHVYVVGPVGTGKKTYVEERVRRHAAGRPVPDDWCYVYNFRDPARPLAVSLPAGEGEVFAAAMEMLVDEIRRELRQAFESEEFQREQGRIAQDFQDRQAALWQRVEEEAREAGFLLERTPTGIATLPLGRGGQPASAGELEALGAEERERLAQAARQFQPRLEEALREQHQLQREARRAALDLRSGTARAVAGRLVEGVRAQYRSWPRIVEYLDQLLEDVVQNIGLFLDSEEEEASPLALLARREAGEDRFRRYRVNVLVSHRGEEHAPVLFERNPSYYNLMGKVEYRSALGTATTDFTLVKAGALHRANGGYLILEAGELLRDPMAWVALKRALKSGEVRVENLNEQFSLVPMGSLRPEPIPLDVQVFLIGSHEIFALLYAADEDFRKLFRTRVEFDAEMPRTPENVARLAGFLLHYAREEGLLPVAADGAAALVEFSSRLAEDQEKLSTRFNELVQVLDEASHWTAGRGAAAVAAEDVWRALEERRYRSNRVEERIRQLFQEGTLLLAVDGGAVGTVNGLAVLSLADYAFARPNRITARVWPGQRGVVHVERESARSGPDHTKGVAILAAYLAGRYGQETALSFSASLTFEQVYDEVDGDSASGAELFAVLSALAELPLDQGVAVTGSVNQLGEIQPIGGVNEKVEGFFRVCKALGLTGRQGVILPRRNVRHLMLHPEVVEAVREGSFHLWAVSTVDEAMEILSGLPREEIDRRVLARLRQMNQTLRRRAVPALGQAGAEGGGAGNGAAASGGAEPSRGEGASKGA